MNTRDILGTSPSPVCHASSLSTLSSYPGCNRKLRTLPRSSLSIEPHLSTLHLLMDTSTKLRTSPHCLTPQSHASPHRIVISTKGNTRETPSFHRYFPDFLGRTLLPRVLSLDDLVHVIFQVYDDFFSRSTFRGIATLKVQHSSRRTRSFHSRSVWRLPSGSF